MVHTLVAAAVVLWVLWIIGLAGGWAVHTAWTLFVVACALFVIWLIAGFAGGSFRRGRMTP